jgi:hypothetical protein
VLASLAAVTPAVDLWDRAVNKLEVWQARSDAGPDGSGVVPLETGLDRLGAALGSDLHPIAAEPGLERIAAEVAARAGAFPPQYDANRALTALCYVLCRAIAPQVAVETGVANGATSAHLLAALGDGGELHSIDWMPGGARRRLPVGELVPDSLRDRWTLEHGPSRRLLPRIVRRVGPVGLFVHDSLHTYRNLRRELDAVLPHMARPAAILADDVHMNAAFSDWVSDVRPACALEVETERPGHVIGVALL